MDKQGWRPLWENPGSATAHLTYFLALWHCFYKGYRVQHCFAGNIIDTMDVILLTMILITLMIALIEMIILQSEFYN